MGYLSAILVIGGNAFALLIICFKPYRTALCKNGTYIQTFKLSASPSPLLQPFSKYKSIPHCNPQAHQIDQCTESVHSTKGLVQSDHFRGMRSIVIILFPVPRFYRSAISASTI